MNKRMHNQKQLSSRMAGFTLIEIMVSVAIFTIIIVAGIGALMSMTRSYQVTQNQKKVHDSLNYALESMTREIRLGKDYTVVPSGIGSPATDGVSHQKLGFQAADNRGYVQYELQEDGTLIINRSGATNAQNGIQSLTDNTQVTVEDIQFTVIGSGSRSDGDYRQPLVLVQMKAIATGAREDLETTVQTLVSQRTLDV